MKYFAMIDGQRVGPCTIDELVEKGLRPTDYVWCKTMPDWQQALEDADICRFFRRRLHDRMHPSVPVSADESLTVNKQAADSEQPFSYFQVRADIARKYRENPDDEHPEEEHVSPVPCPWWLVVVAIICCLPLGLIALSANRAVMRESDAHNLRAAHDSARRAKLAAGLAICIGLMIVATLIRIL